MCSPGVRSVARHTKANRNTLQSEGSWCSAHHTCERVSTSVSCVCVFNDSLGIDVSLHHWNLGRIDESHFLLGGPTVSLLKVTYGKPLRTCI